MRGLPVYTLFDQGDELCGRFDLQYRPKGQHPDQQLRLVLLVIAQLDLIQMVVQFPGLFFKLPETGKRDPKTGK